MCRRPPSVLETAHYRAEHLKIVRVERVEDGLGQQAVALQGAHEQREITRDRFIVDRVEAGVGPQLGEHRRIQVADAGHVQLHGPAAAGIHAPDFEQQCGAEGVDLLRRGLFVFSKSGKNSFEPFAAGEGGERRHQRVIGSARAEFMKNGMTLVKRRDEKTN